MYRLRSAGTGEREHPSIWNSSEAWAACAKALREYDEDMIQDWKEEIDTLLVFAGLFSAVVTTFNIEAYKLLQQQPEDSAVALLTQISSQLNSFMVNTNFINTTSPADVGHIQPFRADAIAVRLNTLWFSSLVCGLLSASLGLLVKQWLREYLAGSSNISREGIRIRQYRYEGLIKWHVPEIILCLPILLQTALLLFFAGLVDLLWTLHPVVAAVITGIIAVSMLFAIVTSLLPPMYPSCPYKSPQAWLICIFVQSLKRSIAALASRYYARLYHNDPSQAQTHSHGAATPDPFASKLDLPTIVHTRLSEQLRAVVHRLSLLRPYASWKERETLATGASRVATALDDATLAGADAMFMDDALLRAVVRPCMRDVAPRAALRCVERILLRRAPRVLHGMPYWELARPVDAARGDLCTLTLMHLLLDVLHRLNDSRTEDFDGVGGGVLDGAGAGGDGGTGDARWRVLLTMHRLVRAIPAPSKSDAPSTESPGRGGDADAETRALFRRMFEVLAGVLATEVGRAAPERFVRERSFNLMLKLFPRFQAVGAPCIIAFCAYSRQIRAENAPYRFVQACYMVIRAAAVLARDAHASTRPPNARSPPTPSSETPSPTLPYSTDQGRRTPAAPMSISRMSSVTLCAEPFQPHQSHQSFQPHQVHEPFRPLHDSDSPGAENADADAADGYAAVRPAVLGILHDLAGFLSAPVARAAEFRPTPAMLAECAQAAVMLARRDRAAVPRALVVALGELVEGEEEEGEKGEDDFGYGWCAGELGEGDVGGGKDTGDGEGGGGGDDGGGKDDDDGAFDAVSHDAAVAGEAVRLLRKMYGVRVRGG